MTKEKRWTIEDKIRDFDRLGAVKEKDGIRFSLSVPQGEKAFLLLYLRGTDQPAEEIPFPKEAAAGSIYSMKLKDFPWKEYEYNFRIGKDVFSDPYAAVICGKKNFAERAENGEGVPTRCGFAFSSFDWGGDVFPSINQEDAVMYHLHVRNFTMDKGAGVRHKGTFWGLKEKIPYLKELGVNQVKLMPVYDFYEFPKTDTNGGGDYRMQVKEPKQNCWGYGRACYFAPKSAYSFSENPVKELKNMIKCFHENGMEVIMDVYFTQELNSRLMADCLVWWRQEYHVDGFHIMGKESMGHFIAADPLFADTKIICSYFPEFSEGILRMGTTRRCIQLNDGFSTDMRRILKGDEGMLEAFVYQNRKNSKDYGVVNYITNHDGFTLRDLVSYDMRHNEENGENNEDGPSCNYSWNCGVEGETKKKAVQELRLRQMKNAVLLLMLSQGTPMIMAGDEFGNSQGGNNNPYCLDNETSWVNWSSLRKNKGFWQFVKDAAAFRKEHKVLHMSSEIRLMDYKSCGYPDLSYHSSRAWYGGFEYNSRQIGMMYCGQYCGEEGLLYVAYNFHPQEQELAMPKLPEGMKWYCAIDTSKKESFEEPQKEFVVGKTRTITVPARTVLVLTGREEE